MLQEWNRRARKDVFMAPTLQALGIDQLSVEDRIVLATATWDSIAAEPHPPLLTEAQRQELQRRLADHAANPDDVVPWERVKAEAIARFAR
jgi:putative addiction module component (TIGR02574 family)